MDLAKYGIQYFQNYYQNLMLFAVSISMIGWMLSMYQQLDDSCNDNALQHFTVKKMVYVLGIIALIALFAYGMHAFCCLERLNFSFIYCVMILQLKTCHMHTPFILFCRYFVGCL